MALRPRVPSPPTPSGPDTGGPLEEPPAAPAAAAPAEPSGPEPAPPPREAPPAEPPPQTDAERERLARALEDTQRELQGLQQWRLQLERAAQPQPQAPNLNTLIFEKPDEALWYVKEQAKQELRQEYQADQARRDQQQGLRDFTSNFYRAHPDLVGLEWVVNTVMEREVAKQGPALLNLPVDRARDEIARATREELLGLQRRAEDMRIQREGQPVPPGRAVVEGGSPATRAPTRREEREDAGPKTLGEVIRARQRRRQEAFERRR